MFLMGEKLHLKNVTLFWTAQNKLWIFYGRREE